MVESKIRIACLRDYKDNGGNGKYDSGIVEVKIDSWPLFFSEIKILTNLGDFVWRGERCDDWKLKSRFDRLYECETINKRNDFLIRHLKNFKEIIKGRRGVYPPMFMDEETWALAQHYGMATPLLDWTESPFVAAFFAFCENDVRQK